MAMNSGVSQGAERLDQNFILCMVASFAVFLLVAQTTVGIFGFVASI